MKKAGTGQPPVRQTEVRPPGVPQVRFHRPPTMGQRFLAINEKKVTFFDRTFGLPACSGSTRPSARSRTMDKRDTRFPYFVHPRSIDGRVWFCFEKLSEWHDACSSKMVNPLEILGGKMKKAIGLLFVIAAASVSARAAGVTVPEINPASAVGALTLLGGAILVLRARLKK